MFHKMTYEQWSAVIRTNLDSMFAMTRPVIEGMRERGCGRIVNISSINGQKGQMGQANYSASKAGIIGFTKALALENARKGHHRQRHLPGLYRHRHGGGRAGQGAGGDHRPDPGRPPRQGRGDRLACRLSRLGRCRLHDRRGPLRQRRAVHKRATPPRRGANRGSCLPGRGSAAFASYRAHQSHRE